MRQLVLVRMDLGLVKMQLVFMRMNPGLVRKQLGLVAQLEVLEQTLYGE